MLDHIFKYLMGAILKDIITGFEGVVIYRVEHITGCDNYGLQPPGLDKDGNPRESKQFDETRLTVVNEGIITLEPKIGPNPKPGGPQPDVSKKH